MDLIFWRHAEAEDRKDGMDDLDRALTPRGEKHAVRVGAWLDRNLPEGTRVLCSPALRCQQTALRLGRKFKLRAELARGAQPADLLGLAQWPDARSTVMLVGHQPALGDTLAQLLKLDPRQCAIRKGAVWWLRGRKHEDECQAIVWAVQSPETT